MAIAQTPFTPPALLAYRSVHRIEVVRDWSEDMGRFVTVCGRDSIRVFERSPGRWAHDVSEVKDLAALERGER